MYGNDDLPEQPPGRSVYTVRKNRVPAPRLSDGRAHPVKVTRLADAETLERSEREKLDEYLDSLDHWPGTHAGRCAEAEARSTLTDR